MRRSSKLFAFLAAAGFLAALAWALVTQANLWQSQRRLPPRPAGGEAPPPEASSTGVQGAVDEGSRQALERHLKAQQEARKRLEALAGK